MMPSQQKGFRSRVAAAGASVSTRAIMLLMVASILLAAGAILVAAHPSFPTIFYGPVYHRNGAAPAGTVITATYNGQPCDSFTIVNPGYFGMLACPGDDPETNGSQGALDGEAVTFLFNGEPVVILQGDPTTTSKQFKWINMTHPIPYCGDSLCDRWFENLINCPFDCINSTTNTTGNTTTNQTGNGTGGGGGGSAGGGGGGGGGGAGGGGAGGGGGGGGGGGAGGGAGALAALFGQLPTFLEGLLEGVPACEENWICNEWPPCPPSGVRNRTCWDENECGTTANKPLLIEACEYIATCFDGVQNGAETGVDCGGPCAPCPSCTNGVQDCQLQAGGETLCEEGIDCGGPCRPCDSCENGIRDWTETDVDCGGLYCAPCRRPPVLQVPLPVCKKEIDPLRNDLIFFLLVMLILIVSRIAYGIRQLKTVRKHDDLDDVEKAKERYRIKRRIYTFVGIIVVITIIIYFYYYYFVLCEAEPKYLWWLVLLLIVTPLVVQLIIRHFEYNEKEKLQKLERAFDAHRKHLIRLVEIENQVLVRLEQELSDEIHGLLKDEGLHDLFTEFPDLGLTYRNMIELYERYKDRKNPFGLERELCEEVYRLETNADFKRLAELHPSVLLVYRKLRLLYSHYETKQQLYDQIDAEDEAIEHDVAGVGKSGGEPEAATGPSGATTSPPAPPVQSEELDDDEGEGFQGSGTAKEKG